MRADANGKTAGESDEAFLAFLQYRDTPPPRTLRSARARVRPDAPQPPRTWKEWSKKYDWEARAGAWDLRHQPGLEYIAPVRVGPDREVMPHDTADVSASRREALAVATTLKHYIKEAISALKGYGGTRVKFKQSGAEVTIDLDSVIRALAEWRNIVAWGRQVPPEITAALHAIMLQRAGEDQGDDGDVTPEAIAQLLQALPSRKGA